MIGIRRRWVSILVRYLRKTKEIVNETLLRILKNHEINQVLVKEGIIVDAEKETLRLYSDFYEWLQGK